MESPFCKSCNRRHGGPCNVFYMANEPVVNTDNMANKVVRATPRVVHEEKAVVHKPVMVVHKSKHGVYADLEKRRAYRREWMRKRRSGENS